jgi:hypothetical protein
MMFFVVVPAPRSSVLTERSGGDAENRTRVQKGETYGSTKHSSLSCSDCGY